MNEKINDILRQPWVRSVAMLLTGLAGGAGTTAMFYRHKIELIYQAAASEFEELKTEQLKLDFERAEKDRDFNKIIGEATEVNREMAARGRDILKMLESVKSFQVIDEEMLVQPAHVNSNKTEEVSQSEVVVKSEGDADQRTMAKLISSGERLAKEAASKVVNVFNNDDDWDWDAEKSNRDSDQPYILHVDEYVADEKDWDSQSTLTWYEGDRVLADSSDTPIYDPDRMIGELKFGHGSGDPNVVFVRNEKLQAEYEILRDPNKYVDVVLGGQLEHEFETGDLKHSRQPRKFRQE